jgi:hypothetical protein
MNNITRVDALLLRKAWHYHVIDLEQAVSQGWRPQDFYVSRVTGWFLLTSLVSRQLMEESSKIEQWRGNPCYRITPAGIDHLQRFETYISRFSAVNRAAYIRAKNLRRVLSVMHEPVLARLYEALVQLPDLTHDQLLHLLSEQILTPGQRRRRKGPVIHPSEDNHNFKKLATLFALVFVETKIDPSELSGQLHQFLHHELTENSGTVNFQLSNGVQVHIHKNEAAKSSVENSSGDFANFPYCLEIDGAGVVQQISVVSKILEGLWEQGIPAIAVCDYAASLPENGGYFMGQYALHRWQKKS